MFFILSNMTILLCFVLHQVVRKTDFVQFYITLCQERNRITLEPTEDVGLVIRFFIYLKLLFSKFRNTT
jgi:solute carrier family 29 (equilibrative nucleoside transporter) protein 4